MKEHDPVDTVTVESEWNSRTYEVRRSHVPRLRAEVLIDSFLVPPELEGNIAEKIIAEEDFQNLREDLIEDAEKRLRFLES